MLQNKSHDYLYQKTNGVKTSCQGLHAVNVYEK